MTTGIRRPGPAVELALRTFAILVLELALIRWLGTQIRIAAYFANLVLVATFLGMGLGVGLGRSRPDLAQWGLPALAVVSIVLAAAGQLGFHRRGDVLALHTGRPAARRRGRSRSSRGRRAGMAAQRHRDVVGAGTGTGNDVAAALRMGFARVGSIDIDPAILSSAPTSIPRSRIRIPE